MNFEDLKLAPAIVKAVREHGYEIPTAIQAQAIPLVLDGHDLLGGAQTGTGKTAAFVLPMLHKLLRILCFTLCLLLAYGQGLRTFIYNTFLFWHDLYLIILAKLNKLIFIRLIIDILFIRARDFLFGDEKSKCID